VLSRRAAGPLDRSVYHEHPIRPHVIAVICEADVGNHSHRSRGARARTNVNYILVARNDTGLRQRKAELQKIYTAQLSHGRSSALGGRDDTNDTVMSDRMDELRWVSTLFRHEQRVFCQGGEDGVIARGVQAFRHHQQICCGIWR
jgi:hypothetical protein